MKKLLIIVACIMAGGASLYAQGIKSPEIIPCYGKSFFRKQEVKFSCATNGARIFYTTDGSTPTAASAEYGTDAPLYIDKTTTVKAIAIIGENTSEISEVTCEKNQRPILIVGEYEGKKYYMEKNPIEKNGPIGAIEYDGKAVMPPMKFKEKAWLLNSNGMLVDKNQVPSLYLTYTDKNVTELGKTGKTWKIEDGEIVSVEDNRTICINSYAGKVYFGAYTSSDNAKAYPVDIKRGTTRTGLTVGNFGTVCLSYDVVASDNEGATFYSILGKKETGGEFTLYLEEENGILKAGIPYIYKVSNETINIYYLDETQVDDHITDGFGSNNGLTGAFGKTIVPKGMYVIYGTKVVKCGDNCICEDCHAYINMDEVPEIGETEAKKAIALSSDGTTEVTEMAIEGDRTTVKQYHNLQGQRVSTPKKGLYILNGKKIIIK